MKRIISSVASDFRQDFSKEDLKQAILDSEGRVIMAQATANNECVIGGISNPELIASFGTDMILLKMIDVEHPSIEGIEASETIIDDIKHLTGRLVGINLEVVGQNHLEYDGGTVLSDITIQKAVSLQPDFLCLTAYRSKPGNDATAVIEALKLARKYYQGLIILNKYMSSSELKNETHFEDYVSAGADVITLPMPGSVAGVYVEMLAPIVEQVKNAGALVSMAVSTSQEGSDIQTMKSMALMAKQAGADMYDFGDANSNGIAAPENIFALSLAVRGKRHTYFRIASSIRR